MPLQAAAQLLVVLVICSGVDGWGSRGGSRHTGSESSARLAFGWGALLPRWRGERRDAGRRQDGSGTGITVSTARTANQRKPVCIAGMPGDYLGTGGSAGTGAGAGSFGGLFRGPWPAGSNGAGATPTPAIVAATGGPGSSSGAGASAAMNPSAAAAVSADGGFEPSTLPPAEEAAWLNRGLVRLSGVFGWCRSPADIVALEALRQELLPAMPYATEAEKRRVCVALEVAYHAHGAQKRKSGEPFVMHPLAVTQILASLQMDADVLVAGLLHDTVEDTRLSFADIEAVFGRTVRRIVEGETKVSKLPGRHGAYNATLELDAAAAAAADAAAATSGRNRASGVAPAPPLRPAESRQVENLRHMLIAMSEDWRVLVVKLADRLHNMRTIGAMAPHKQLRIARETMDVFVPLAHRLGLWGIKCELEDLCFAVLQPQEHDKLRRLVAGREALTQHTPRVLEETRAMLEEQLWQSWAASGAAGSSSSGPKLGTLRVEVHPKPLYRIWRTMQRSGSNFYIQHDVASFRVVFSLAPEPVSDVGMSAASSPFAAATSAAAAVPEKVPSGAERRPQSYEAAMQEKRSCYSLLEAMHALLPPTDPPRVKDYIAFPKSNGYSSLHSTVFLRGYPVELQVRTEWMERVAEHGVAASWLGRDAQAQACSVRLPWLREAQQEADASASSVGEGLPCGDAYAASIRQSLQGAVGRRFVFTGQGTILNLAANATVRDAALELHDSRKLRVVAAKVNSRLVGFNHRLKDGDVVTVVTAPYAGTVGDTDADANTDAAAETVGSVAAGSGGEAYALGAVHVQLVGSSVWPWSLIGDSDAGNSATEPAGGSSAAGDATMRFDSLSASQVRAELLRTWSPLSPATPASLTARRAALAAKRQALPLAAAAEDPASVRRRPGSAAGKARKGIDGGQSGSNRGGGDFGWYRLAEVKHGRMSMLALFAWLNIELLEAIGSRGATLGPTAAGVHGSAFVYLYSMTPSQLIHLIVGVGCLEFANGVWSNLHGGGASVRRLSRLFDTAAGDGTAASDGGGEAERERMSVRAAVLETARAMGSNELSTGRLAMVAIVSLLLQSTLQSDGPMGSLLGLF